MKFARYLSENLVPEWRVQYLDYKAGKKKLKKISPEADQTSSRRSSSKRSPNLLRTPRWKGRSSSVAGTVSTTNDSPNSQFHYSAELPPSDALPPPAVVNDHHSPATNVAGLVAVAPIGITPQQLLQTKTSPPGSMASAIDIPARRINSDENAGDLGVYGSLIATPPTKQHGFELPPPAIDSVSPLPAPASTPAVRTRQSSVSFSTSPAPFDPVMPSPLGLGAPAIPASPYKASKKSEGSRSILKKHSKYDSTANSNPSVSPAFGAPLNKQATFSPSDSFSQRKFVSKSTTAVVSTSIANSEDQVRRRVAIDPEVRDFMVWLDGEFAKITEFYKTKENEAIERFEKLKEQLHLLRDQRLDEKRKIDVLRAEQEAKRMAEANKSIGDRLAQQMEDIHRKLDLHHLPFMPKLKEQPTGSAGQDYVRGNPIKAVPYTVARRKLKHAMMEYYRGLELLKSYRLLNRTAFQKICKKFDKTSGVALSPMYMDKVLHSNFGQSEVVDELMNVTEDVYSRYFERGNRKHAIEKLRSREIPDTHYSATFFSAICLGLGLPLFIQAIIIGVEKGLRHELEEVTYLFQIFGGGFLMTLFCLLFAMNCMVWARNKINYVFIFEFDLHHILDWREFLELPSFLFFWLSLCMYLCMSDFWPDKLPAYWWTLIYICVSVVIVFMPFPIFNWRAREWLVIALWRLFFSGLYPVEFRDFFLGDIFCSLTYSVSNIDLFFCLFAHNWTETAVCGSSRSRLMGFLSALPPIWRFLQCLRRYADTRNWFPHLANAGKYTFTIATAVVLSVWRIDRLDTNRNVYIFFVLVNTVYSGFWDLFMDWSLFQANSQHKLLRDELGFRDPRWYYAAMIIDPVLRFNWVFYVIFPVQIQQSAVTSFLIALVEVLRRFVWIFFRMENEHCANVTRFQASRNLPLPYELEVDGDYDHEMVDIDVRTPLMAAEEGRATAYETASGRGSEGSQDGRGQGPAPLPTPSLRRRSMAAMTPRMLATAASNAMQTAHVQDFERRKRRPRADLSKPGSGSGGAGSSRTGSILSRRSGSIIYHEDNGDEFDDDGDDEEDDDDLYNVDDTEPEGQSSDEEDLDMMSEASPGLRPDM
ncbi:EXS family-domain-containing protein [Lipomyces oligophaga]|uniref:EXS family-domain-containing protein n=1 Tax=Lipomyces oligophaga TaxID=45792 RepID=UPI0034CF178A